MPSSSSSGSSLELVGVDADSAEALASERTPNTATRVQLADSLLNDIELFAAHTARLRRALESAALDAAGTERTAKCMQTHASLALVSQSVRDLLVRHPRLFKTAEVLLPASQLVHSIKTIGGEQPEASSASLQALQRLEDAIASTIRGALRSHALSMAAVDLQSPLLQRQDQGGSGVEGGAEGTRTGVQKAPSCSSSSGVSSSPNAGGPSPLKLIRRHSAFQLPSHRLTTAAFSKFASPPPSTRFAPPSASAQLLRVPALPQRAGVQQRQSMCQLLDARGDGLELAFERCKAWSKYASQLLQIVRQRLAAEQECVQKLQRHAEQAKTQLAQCAAAHPMAGPMPLAPIFEQLMHSAQQFAGRTERTVATLQQRVVANLEGRQKEHDSRRRKLKVEWSKQRKQLDQCAEELRRAQNTHSSKDEQYLRAKEVTMRQEQQWQLLPPGGPPALNPTNVIGSSNGGGMGAVAAQMLMSVGGGGSREQLMRKRCSKEVEKRRRAEEEALSRKSDAENDVRRLERELDERTERLHELRRYTVHELSDLIRQCELTTIASSSTLLRGYADLYRPVPVEFERLADATRGSAPGEDFMHFLQHSAPPSAPSSGSAHDTGEVSSNFGNGTGATTSSLSSSALTTPCSEQRRLRPQRLSMSTGEASSSLPSSSAASSMLPSPCRAQQRRNALTSAEEAEMAQKQKQQAKRRGMRGTAARLFDTAAQSSTVVPVQMSEAARSHRLQRTRQMTKCAQCEHLLIFDALKCHSCGLVWHKKCLSTVQLRCGETAKRLTETNQRRMSIFGVPLKGHLEAQQRTVPLIVECCVDELQRRGMRCKGLYRTCGVKSKVEQICVQFEQTPSADSQQQSVDLSDVHPMNIASVVKLYLRRLPEPLLSHELYEDWLALESCHASDWGRGRTVSALRTLVQRLPALNVDTLKFLMLHLNRVTWFELDNLMTAANLAAVIAPSLLWPANYASQTDSSAAAHCSAAFINDAHRQSKAVELLIRHSHEVFSVDPHVDWRAFFAAYPELTEPPEGLPTLDQGRTAALALDDTLADEEEEEDELECEEEDEMLEEEEEEDEEEEQDLLIAGIGEHERQRAVSEVIAAEDGSGTNAQRTAWAGIGSHNAAGDGKRPMESSGSSLDCGSSAASTMFRHRQRQQPFGNFSSDPSSAAPASSLSPQITARHRRPQFPVPPGTAPPSLRRLANGKSGLKPRSFTTSILVSPVLTARERERQHCSMEGTDANECDKGTTNSDKTEELQSGEVTVQLRKDQRPFIGSSEEELKHRLCTLQSVILAHNDDVSYV